MSKYISTIIMISLMFFSVTTFANQGGDYFGSGSSWHGEANVGDNRPNNSSVGGEEGQTCAWVPAHYDARGRYIRGANVCQ